MPAIVVRNISAETHRALRVRARQHGRSTEAEIRAILDGAVRPTARIKLGSALAALVKPFGGLELEIKRDKKPAKPASAFGTGPKAGRKTSRKPSRTSRSPLRSDSAVLRSFRCGSALPRRCWKTRRPARWSISFKPTRPRFALPRRPPIGR